MWSVSYEKKDIDYSVSEFLDNLLSLFWKMEVSSFLSYLKLLGQASCSYKSAVPTIFIDFFTAGRCSEALYFLVQF
jgi:hypothetical protein